MSDEVRTRSESITDAVLAVLNVASDQESKQAILDHWEYLDNDEADEVIADLIDQDREDKDSVQYLRTVRYLLYRCRNDGLHRALSTPLRLPVTLYDALARFLDAKGNSSAKEVVSAERPILLSDDADHHLAFMSRFFRDDARTQSHIETRREQLRKVHVVGLNAAFPPDTIDVPESLLDALEALMNARSNAERVAVLRLHESELLSDDADRCVAFFASVPNSEGDPVIQALKEQRILLGRCREQGIDAVFGITADQTPASPPTPPREMVEELLSEIHRIAGKELVSADIGEAIVGHRPDLRPAWDYIQAAAVPIQASDSGRMRLQQLFKSLLETDEREFAKCIEILREALRVPLVERMPAVRASLHHELGSALTQCPTARRTEFLEEALHHHSLALTILGAKEWPEERANNLADMGNTFIQRRTGDLADNVEQALACYEEAIKLYEGIDKSIPYLWDSNLGNIYNQRIRGAQSENIEKAIEHLQKALRAVDRASDPKGWADAQLNLGNVSSVRLQFDRLANAEHAIACYKRALEVYEHLPDAEDRRGLAHLALARLYASAIMQEHPNSEEQAIESAEKAIAVLPKESWPEKWANAHCILAGYLIRSRDVNNLRKAVVLLRTAETVCDRYRAPTEWAQVQGALGAAYGTLYHEGQGHFDEAVATLQCALEVYTRDQHPQRWSSMHYNLGFLYASAPDIDPDSCRLAQEHLHFALKNRDIESNPAAYFEVQDVLGTMHFQLGQWQEAHEAFECAIAAASALLTRSFTVEGKRFETGTTGDIFAMNAFCLIENGQLEAAVSTLEAGKTRLLSQALAMADADVKELHDDDRAEFLTAREALRKAQYAADGIDSDGQASGVAGDLLQTAQERLDKLITLIRTRVPGFLRLACPGSGLLPLAPVNGAIVVFFVTPRGGGAFVVPEGTRTLRSEHVLRIEELTVSRVNQLLFGSSPDAADGLFHHYHSSTTRIGAQAWLASLDQLYSRLWDLAIMPLFERLEKLGIAENAPLVIVPQGRLGLLPLHAAWRLLNGQKRYFTDDFAISYSPSGYALAASRQRLANRPVTRRSVLTIVDPTCDLSYSLAEGDAVATFFPTSDAVSLVHDAATREAVCALAAGRTYIHFACHGSYDWQAPMQSGLHLAQSTDLTAEDVVRYLNLEKSRLVVLSACETGVVDFGRAYDEYFGLPAAFLQAGTPAVISTLWPVNDLSTMLLMQHFYDLHLNGARDVGAALRGAQLWLRTLTASELTDRLEEMRDFASNRRSPNFEQARRNLQGRSRSASPESTPFAHPHYWAAFTLVGA